MRPVRFIVLMALCSTAVALPWSKDMVDQPSVKPQQSAVKEAKNSVPKTGKEFMPVPKDLAEVVQSRLEAARTLNNPEKIDPASLKRGKEVYDVHCLVCHGATGKGDGLVGKKFVPPPMDLTTEYVQQQADGQIFYTITHGGVAMPFYREAIKPVDRWHLVNFIKSGIKAE